MGSPNVFKGQSLIANAESGLYQPGETFLYRLDPRVKVLSCLLLVSLAFSAGWSQLFALILTTAIGVCFVSHALGSIWRVCWMLRWLVLFTLLMHLLLSPGRTLWGLSWLSFDGLLMGGLICAQMLLAVVVSALLAITTSTATLARTFGWFVQPLQWLGCRTEEWQRLLLLTMDFIPTVQEEMNTSMSSDIDKHAESASRVRAGRWSVWSQKLHDFLLRLMDRGDIIAHSIAADDDSRHLPPELSPLMPMVLHDQLFSLAIAVVVICYWLAG